MTLTDALSGITVLELGSAIAGPYAAQVLGGMGADVIKVEPPTGDTFRGSQPMTETGLSGFFAMCNSGKRSISLDLKTNEGVRAYRDLATTADVVVENFRPGVADRLGVGYTNLQAENESLVYCSISGYGNQSPWSQRPAFDPILQGVTGLMSTTGERGGPPVRIGVAVVDFTTAIWSVTAVLNALYARERTNEGTYIDMSMFGAAFSLLAKQVAVYALTGEDSPRMGTQYTWTVPYGAYTTKDAQQVVIGASFPSAWEALCRCLDREDLIDDPRFETRTARVENRDALHDILTVEFKKKTQDEWLELFKGEVPAGPLLSVSEALETEQAETSGIRSTVEHEGHGRLSVLNLPLRDGDGRHRFEMPPPARGEHSRRILREIGYDDATLDFLEEEGVLGD